MRTLALTVAALALGCKASGSTYVRGGDVLLDGQGYLTTISDNARTASGRDVTLDPATPKTTVADETGKFKFSGVASAVIDLAEGEQKAVIIKQVSEQP